jgi:uncharacterized membrane protein YdbT with pleckstrin-like domain
MIAFLYLDQVLCWLSKMPALVLKALVDFANLIIAGIGAAITTLIALLPDMPTYTPFITDSSLLSTANWFYPFGALVDAIGAVLTLWAVWLGIRIILNWLRVINAG